MRKIFHEYELVKNIPFQKIDLHPSDFSLEYYCKDEMDSGGDTWSYISYPPVLIHEEGRYTIVLGKKYVYTLVERKSDVPFGLVIKRKGNDYQFFTHLLCLKKDLQGYNVIEKSIAVKKMHDMKGQTDLRILDLLGIPKRIEYVDRYLQLYGACDEMKSLLVRGDLHENTAFEIIKFEKSMWKDVAVFLNDIALGTKKKNLICTMLREVAGDDQTKLRKIINSLELKKINELRIDPLHRGERIFRFIEELRYPAISSYRKRFNEKLKAVGIQKDFHLTLPKDFETWDFKVTVSFSSAEELKRNADKLKKYADTKAFSDLMKMRG
jgi:hypothetical protein